MKQEQDRNDDLENRFSYHKPLNDETLKKYEDVRALLKDCAYFINDVCPYSRERALAITKLEEAMFWANAAIARNPVKAE